MDSHRILIEPTSLGDRAQRYRVASELGGVCYRYRANPIAFPPGQL